MPFLTVPLLTSSGFTALLAVVIGLGTVSEPNPQWGDDYGKSLEATRDAEQPLLVVLERPEDAVSESNWLTSDKTKAAKALSFTLCRVDVSTDYGRRVARAFGAEQFPHTSVIDHAGQVIKFRKTGAFTADEWVSMLNNHRKGGPLPAEIESESTDASTAYPQIGLPAESYAMGFSSSDGTAWGYSSGGAALGSSFSSVATNSAPANAAPSASAAGTCYT